MFQPNGIPGANPPPVSIHPTQGQAIYNQIKDHLTPQEIGELRSLITPRFIQLLYKAHLPQFAQLFEPAIGIGAHNAPVQPPQQNNIAQMLYQGIRNGQIPVPQNGPQIPMGVRPPVGNV